MNKQDVTRSLIELVIDQGIRDMKINSHRSIRRLADLGRQFAKGRFQDRIFSIFQRMLSRDDSPYYEMIDRLLAGVEPASIKRFGMNIGYNGWTHGAALLRKKSAESQQPCPWFLQFSWDPASSLTLKDISSLITENKKNGTYCYGIRVKESLRGNTALFDLFSSHADCAFLLDLTCSDCALTKEQLLSVSKCPNLMILLPGGSPDCGALSEALLAQRSLFAISCRYLEEEADAITEPFFVNKFLSYGSVFLMFIPDSSCSVQAQKKAADAILKARMEQQYPAILMEWNADLERVNQIIYDQK